jgi:putative Mg2+ transporter-C (MgtC) family protein
VYMPQGPVDPYEIFKLLELFAPKVFFALAAGAMVGFERELKHKAAGLKTNMLICLGAAIYTTLSMLMAQSNPGHTGDPGRLAAQIVSGIGFLGGGAIIQSRGTVQGLTTAATIWVVASLGVAVGLGYGWLAVAISVVVVTALVTTTYIEGKIFGRFAFFDCEVTIDDPTGAVRDKINIIIEKNGLTLEDFDLAFRGEAHTLLNIRVRGYRDDFKRFMLSLWSIRGVKEVRQGTI